MIGGNGARGNLALDDACVGELRLHANSLEERDARLLAAERLVVVGVDDRFAEPIGVQHLALPVQGPALVEDHLAVVEDAGSPDGIDVSESLGANGARGGVDILARDARFRRVDSGALRRQHGIVNPPHFLNQFSAWHSHFHNPP